MKKLLLFITVTVMLYAQSALNIHHNLNNGNWTTPPGVALASKGGVKGITIQAVGTGTREFLFNQNGTTWYKVWYDTVSSFNIIKGAYTGAGDVYNIKINTNDQNYYTFNVQYNTSNGVDFCVIETDYEPKSISTVTQSPAGYFQLPNQNLTITATMSAQLSTNEKAFIRYTTDNWATSQFVAMSHTSGNNYQGTIPGQASGEVKYYILTTIQNTPAHNTVDFHTLNLNNNSGTNYSVKFENKVVYISGDFNASNNVWGASAMTLRSMGVANWKYTLNYTGTTGQQEYKFRISDTAWPNPGNWGAGSGVALNTKATMLVNGGNTTTSLTQNKFYTFIFKEVPNDQNSELVVMETDAQPITITNVAISPSTTITNNQKAAVNITLSGAKSPQERVYLRYTTDNWNTSTAVDITNLISGTSASYEFPYLSKNTTVKFYLLTSTKENLNADFDLFTLNYNNNSGNNYTITVNDNGSTTYNNPSLAAGTPVDVGFRANEKLGTTGSTDYYVTWDAYNIYFAFTGGSHIDNDKYNIAIDVDPNGTNGTDLIFNGVNYTDMTQKIDYHIEVVKSGLPVAKLFKNNAGNYEYVKDIPNYCDGSNVKIKLPIEDLTGATGVNAYNPQNPIQFVMFISNNNSKPFTIYPADTNANGSNDITAKKAVKFASLATGMVPSTSQSESLLPVELVENSFKGQVIDNKVILTWSTATEINNKGFEVEKLVNNNWKSIGFVNGSGNSNATKHYRFEDVLTSNKLQYRLKQVDNDGKYSYSEIIEVIANIKLSYDLKQNYPNPFNPTTKITFELPIKTFAQIKVYNVLGSEVATLINNVMEEGIHTVDFNAGNLPAGVYFVTMKANGFAKTIKVNLLK